MLPIARRPKESQPYSDMPKHLISKQMYQCLELKRTQKEEADHELQKLQHREERVQKKKKQEEEL